MATIVIHGTMTHRRSTSVRWWWDSWHEGGFLDAVRNGMVDASDYHDLWHVDGLPVSAVPQLQRKFSWLKGYSGQPTTHQGHFIWSGADDYSAREAGAYHLVRYLNLVQEVAPDEPHSIIAHSHGCNVVKMASGNADLSQEVHFPRAVFLACPHFETPGAAGPTYPYQLNPDRFGEVLNLFSEKDTVQVGFADRIPGYTGVVLGHEAGVSSHRVDQDPQADHKYDNWELETEDAGVAAHAAVHGASVGFLIGYWLASDFLFEQIMAALGDGQFPIPSGDHGE